MKRLKLVRHKRKEPARHLRNIFWGVVGVFDVLVEKKRIP
jgi:hypothetical protein